MKFLSPMQLLEAIVKNDSAVLAEGSLVASNEHQSGSVTTAQPIHEQAEATENILEAPPARKMPKRRAGGSAASREPSAVPEEIQVPPVSEQSEPPKSEETQDTTVTRRVSSPVIANISC